MSGDFSSQVFLPSVLRVGGGSVVSLYPGLERTATCSGGRLVIHSGLGSIFAPDPVGLQDSAVGIFAGDETLRIASFPGAKALKGGSANDEQVASFEHRLFDRGPCRLCL